MLAHLQANGQTEIDLYADFDWIIISNNLFIVLIVSHFKN